MIVLLRSFILPLVFILPIKSWAMFVAADDDLWWDAQYNKIHGTNDCASLKAALDEARAFDRLASFTSAQTGLAWHYWQGPCLDNDIAFAERLLQGAAERGNHIAAVYLAQMYFLEHGEDAALSKEWAQRAQYAMAPFASFDWKQTFYAPHAEHFRAKGQTFSPHLEQAFAWLEAPQQRDPNALYEIGMTLFEDDTVPEAKINACHWLNAAQRTGHVQARYRLARQLIYGEGVMQNLDRGNLLLDQSINQDQYIEAYMLAAQLLEKGDLFNKDLRKAYIALLRAQQQGGNIDQATFDRIEAQLSPSKIEWSKKDASDSRYLIYLFMTPEMKPQNESTTSHNICVSMPSEYRR